MDTTRTPEAPTALVHDYVARGDSLGYFAGGPKSNDDWLMRIAECPGHQGGSDVASVAVRHAINPLSVGPDTARYVVEHQAIGFVEPTESAGMHFVARPGPIMDTVTAVRTPYGWRIAGQVGVVIVSPATAIRLFHLPPDQATQVDSLAASRE